MSARIRDLRPVLHFTPEKGWINDPNGLVYDGKQYHLFAQHNPGDIVWGPMHWLHAISNDLISWREVGIALYPNAAGTIFSGSAVIDKDNTAGFGHGAMVVVYTHHGESENQCLAYSLDGVQFEHYQGNPVIQNPGIRDFRDPKVFWYEKGGCWVMALAAGDCIAFYRSYDLKTWEKTGAFGKKENRYGHVFECPDLFMLTGPDGREHWVLLTSMVAEPDMGGSRMQYFIGSFHGETFLQDVDAGETLFVDAGMDNYAGVTFSGTADKVYMGWAVSPVYAGRVPAKGYRGQMTLPRRLKLVTAKAGLRLAAEPLLAGSNFSMVTDGGTLPTGAFELQIKAEGPFEVTLHNDIGEELRFGLGDDGCIFTDRTKAGETGFDPWYESAMYSITNTHRRLEGPFDLRLILDQTIAELYADQGTYVNTMLVYPKQAYTHVCIKGQVSVQKASL